MKSQFKYYVAVLVAIVLFSAAAWSFLSPVVKVYRDMESAKRRVTNDLDHAAILESASLLLANTTTQFIDPIDLPDAIAETKPNSVAILNGEVHVEYGGGFTHYGLIADPDNVHRTDRFYQQGGYNEKRLIDNVYYYETE